MVARGRYALHPLRAAGTPLMPLLRPLLVLATILIAILAAPLIIAWALTNQKGH